ncbi:MAG: CHAT domain-containing protein [Syntrophobacterales bacterium]|jgi:CHAT domain-containing protein
MGKHRYFSKLSSVELWNNIYPSNVFLFFILISVLLFPACTKKMSLEEAKEVPIFISEKSFVLPPRRIDDITNILDQNPPDPAAVQRLIATADAIPPASASKVKLQNFYYQRGMAAAKLGRYKQSLEDLRKAVNLLGDFSSRTPTINKIIIESCLAEIRVNNFRAGIVFAERAREKFPYWVGVNNLLVNLYAITGDLERAEKAKDRAIKLMLVWRDSPSSNTWRRYITATMRAAILEARGRYKEAEPLRRRAIQLGMMPIIKSEYPKNSIRNRLSLAKNLMEQNRLVEAEVESREAVLEYISLLGSRSLDTRWSVEVLATILSKQGRHQEAKRLLNQLIAVMEAGGISDDSPAMGWTRYQLANVLVEMEDWSEADKEFRLATISLGTERAFRKRSLLQSSRALSLLRRGHSKDALRLLQKAREAAEQNYGADHYRTLEIYGLLAVALFDTGSTSGALDLFSGTVPSLLENRAVGAQQKKFVLERYLNLLARIRGTSIERQAGVDAVAEAFRIAGALQAQSVQHALAQSLSRAALHTPEMADLARREQDAWKQIDALESLLSEHLAAPVDQQYPEVLEELKKDIKRLHRAHKVLIQRIEEETPRYARLLNPPPATVAEVQEQLRSGEVLVSIYPTVAETYVWTIPSEGKIQFTVAPFGENYMQESIRLLRHAFTPETRTFGGIPEFDLARAYDIYAALLKPTEASLREARDLIIAATGSLAQLPFSILPTDSVSLGKEKGELFSRYRNVAWLIRRVSITRVPTAFSFISLRTLRQGDPSRKAFLGFGDPFFNREQLARAKKERSDPKLVLAKRGRDLHVRGIRVTESGTLDNETITSINLGLLNRLPGTEDEIVSICRALGGDPARDVFLGEKASESQVKSMDMSDRRVIAFATHALVPGDLDGLDQPALALSSPAVTGDSEDGLLTMEEIFQLKLNADWVVLSACNTGAAEGAGAEAVSGLGRAFFYAGSRALLVSMWPVETTSARKLTTGLFRHQKENPKLSRARALRKSMIELIDGPGLKDEPTGKIVASYAHPLFWAPFIIVGDGGGDTY